MEPRREKRLKFIITLILFLTSSFGIATCAHGSYDIGSPTLTDIWVDPVNGNDSNSGTDRNNALRTLTEAWSHIPSGQSLTGTGYRLMLTAGEYPESLIPSYWDKRYGTSQFPIIIQSADGPQTARITSFVNIHDTRYLYLIDLAIVTNGDSLHCEECDHILIRGSRIDGGLHQAHETIKMNQSTYIYIEDSDIYGAYENAIDFVAVQYGHIIYNKIHDGDDWCIYLKGGSAYFLIEGNQIYNCGTGGFTAGQGTGFEYMVSPWLHYETYDIKFVNNIVHDTAGAGIGVNGGYNILMAYNTLYRVGSRSHGIEVVFGLRHCDGNDAACQSWYNAGGWGTTGPSEEPIPDRNVYIYNNILYNPPGFQSQWTHFAIYGPQTPSQGSHIPTPACTDTNLQIRGNIIWNGPTDLPLGVEESDQGCQSSNYTCNETQLRSDNAINILEPQLVNPTGGNFRPTPNGNVFNVTTYATPDFSWNDAPTQPAIPQGTLSNQVALDRDKNPRSSSGPPGAYSGGTTPPSTFTLTVTKGGSGKGSVVSTPAGINCGSDCTEAYNSGTVVTLTATPASGFTFEGWSGACSGTGQCSVTMDANKTVTATFNQQQYTLTVTKAGTGSGTVTSNPAGINCGSDCSETYTKVQKVKLTAKADTDSTFTGWSGGSCSGTKTCTVTVDATITVTASFALKTPDISVVQTTLEFGGIKVGKKGTKTLKITNNGTGDLVITPSGLEGTDFSVQGSSIVTIKTKKSYSLKVLFTPKSSGLETATLRMSSNDPDTPILEISLSGTGQ